MIKVQRKPVSELCELIVDCVNRTAPVVEHETPYKMIRTTNVRDGRINLEGARNVTEETFERWTRRAKVLDGDVILTREAPIGEVGFVNGLGHVFLGQRIMQYRPDPELINPRYFFYAFRSKDLQHQFGSHDGSGSVVSHIRVGDCHKFEMSVPDRPIQDAIVNLLGALDDKIELNRRMNETLEEMARALFRDWFVDFGPTRRQMEGATDPAAIMGHAFPAGDRPAEMGTGSAPGISTTKPLNATTLAPLFPARLGDDGLPEGWESGRLDDWATSSPKTVKPDEVDPDTNYIGLEHMPRRSIALSDWETAEKVTSSKARFTKGQVLFGKLRPYFHKVGIAPVDGICSTDIVVVDGLSKALVPFVAMLMSSDEFVGYTNQSSTGTKMPRTSWKLMRDYRIARPPVATVEAFGSVVQPMHDKITYSLGENQTLAALRDLLLPKLMSGEIRLKDAEDAL